MRMLVILTTMMAVFSSGMFSDSHQVTFAEQDIPSYAKWGRLAMKETQAKYPNAVIVDYLHRGREHKDDTAVEKFKLWLRENEKEFGVFIDIKFNTKTEEVVDISFRETTN
ncbi:DUF3889 domain-containing protein [Lentibacillus cibarius]|uniref:DUF3889 domain-containing protein n=1 Tax=Lentibacillus cibarius TaxID=2583219 RepID=A0A549YGC9_9BACI|nr:YqzG/YhdC family protein [Lentibacillus cibarius]TRM10887.1 DUF3889 domain-containing protein [Lentibacillus cibarius]